LGTLAASWSRDLGRDGFTLSGYHTRENFHASFTAIGAGRKTETLSFSQHAPSEATGFDGVVRHQGTGWTGLAGADYVRVEGSSSDFLVPTGLRFGEGTRIERGVFGQVGFNGGPAHLFLGAREDFTGNGNSFFSPSFGINAGKGRLRGRVAAYRSFRAPTLNELFRTFRAGNTVTNANPNLSLEKLFGAEAGFDIVGESRRLRVTAFRNSVDGVITNVTISATPSLITKQRQNAQEAVTHGVEANFEQRWRNFRGELSYLFADSRYVNGLRVPQVAKTQGTAQLIWNHRRTFISGGVRAYSLQFEDDINTLPLPGYSAVQVVARQGLTRSLSASAAIENLLDHQFLTGKTPAAQIGGPRLWRIGLRWDGRIR
jgi:outer membrane receptor protein involved in Fe transport